MRKTAFSALGLILDTEEAGFRTVVLFIVDFITLCQQLRGIHFFHNTLIPFYLSPMGFLMDVEKKKRSLCLVCPGCTILGTRTAARHA